MPVNFHTADISFNLKDKSLFRKWIISEISGYSHLAGEISLIFCSDDYLLEINKKYLSHDFYTDIVTFDYSTGNLISGDLFISIDRVTDNANALKIQTSLELKRVIIHGILHLLGFEDGNEALKQKIHELEDLSISRFPL